MQALSFDNLVTKAKDAGLLLSKAGDTYTLRDSLTRRTFKANIPGLQYVKLAIEAYASGQVTTLAEPLLTQQPTVTVTAREQQIIQQTKENLVKTKTASPKSDIMATTIKKGKEYKFEKLLKVADDMYHANDKLFMDTNPLTPNNISVELANTYITEQTNRKLVADMVSSKLSSVADKLANLKR